MVHPAAGRGATVAPSRDGRRRGGGGTRRGDGGRRACPIGHGRGKRRRRDVQRIGDDVVYRGAIDRASRRATAAAAGAAVVSGNGGPAKNAPPPPQRARRDRGKNGADVSRLLDVTVHRARTHTDRQRRAGLVERATSHTSPILTHSAARAVTTDGLISSKTGRLFIGC